MSNTSAPHFLKYRHRLLWLLIAAFWTEPSYAQDWIQLSRTPDVLVEIDKRSFNFLSKGKFRYWERHTFDPPRETSRGDMTQLLILREGNCAEQFDETIQMFMKSSNLQTQTPIDVIRERTRRYAAPGTTIKTVLDEACAKTLEVDQEKTF